MKTATFAFTAALCAATVAVAADYNPKLRTYTYSRDHFKMSAPAEWHELTPEELNEIATGARATQKGAKVAGYNHGFQATANATYPRILIQIKTGAKFPDNVFTSTPKLEDDAALAQMADGKLMRDDKNHILWTRRHFNAVADGTEVDILIGVIPTTDGSIQIQCMAPANVYASYVPLFQRIISSVQLDDNVKYWPAAAAPSTGD